MRLRNFSSVIRVAYAQVYTRASCAYALWAHKLFPVDLYHDGCGAEPGLKRVGSAASRSRQGSLRLLFELDARQLHDQWLHRMRQWLALVRDLESRLLGRAICKQWRDKWGLVLL